MKLTGSSFHVIKKTTLPILKTTTKVSEGKHDFLLKVNIVTLYNRSLSQHDYLMNAFLTAVMRLILKVMVLNSQKLKVIKWKLTRCCNVLKMFIN